MSTFSSSEEQEEDTKNFSIKNGHRVWKAASSTDSPKPPPVTKDADANANDNDDSELPITTWKTAIDEESDTLKSMLDNIALQERQGSRMRQAHMGVIREDPQEDMRLLIENYTVPALASALRDREDTLQHCAELLSNNRLVELADMLRPYEKQYIIVRRRHDRLLDLTQALDRPTLELLRKGLMRMPRRVSQAHQHRAGVVLPLCNVNGVPCILLEKRSAHLRAHPDEVCLPGGMVSTVDDTSIVATCLREMEEEIAGLSTSTTTVLGVLRCNWGEVHHLVGVAVTPVVCFLGEIGHHHLQPSPDEVSECFTVPLSTFLDRQRWVIRENVAPIFTGGPHIIWGLTGYIINRFIKDIIAQNTIKVSDGTIL